MSHNTGQTQEAAESIMAPAIADVSYRNYDGPLVTHAVRWWVISAATIRQNLKLHRIGYSVIAGFILFAYLVGGVLFYATNTASKNFGIDFLNDPNPYATTLHNAMNSFLPVVLLFAAALTVGAGSISADNRANALLVYLSKPITRWDYLIGKWVGVFLLLLALTLVPNLLMYAFFLGTYADEGFLKDNPTLFIRMLLASLVGPLLHTSLIIGISAWTKSPRITGASYAALYFVSSIVSGIAGNAAASALEANPTETRGRTYGIVNHTSISGVVSGLSMNIYDVTGQQAALQRRVGRRRSDKPLSEQEKERLEKRLKEPELEYDRPPLAPLAGIALAYLLLPLLAAIARVRAVEIVRG